MAQVTIEMEAFSFQVPDEKTLIINLDGGGSIRINVDSLSTLSAVINQALSSSPTETQDSSTAADDDDDDDDDDANKDSYGRLFDPIEPLNAGLGGLDMHSDSFDEIEMQQLHF